MPSQEAHQESEVSLESVSEEDIGEIKKQDATALRLIGDNFLSNEEIEAVIDACNDEEAPQIETKFRTRSKDEEAKEMAECQLIVEKRPRAMRSQI